jgi:glycosyltransferase involved in cell wall biosynthesis
MKHSFAIIAYKDSAYLEDCILSLLSQSVKSKIYISTSTPSEYISALAQKYDLDVFLNLLSKGIASDWSFAYNKAKTKYVTLAHQDDIYAKDYTKECLKHAESLEHEGSLAGNLITFTDYSELVDGVERNNSLLLFIKKILLLVFGVKNSLYFGSVIPCPSVMYNKENIGEFSFNDKFSINLDWEAWIRLSEKGEFTFVNKRLMSHRIHPEAETSKGIKDNRRKNEDKILFTKLWGKTLGPVVSKIYSLSYLLNK